VTTTVGHLPKLVQRMKKIKGRKPRSGRKSPQKKPSFSPAGALLSKMSSGAY